MMNTTLLTLTFALALTEAQRLNAAASVAATLGRRLPGAASTLTAEATALEGGQTVLKLTLGDLTLDRTVTLLTGVNSALGRVLPGVKYQVELLVQDTGVTDHAATDHDGTEIELPRGLGLGCWLPAVELAERWESDPERVLLDDEADEQTVRLARTVMDDIGLGELRRHGVVPEYVRVILFTYRPGTQDLGQVWMSEDEQNFTRVL